MKQLWPILRDWSLTTGSGGRGYKTEGWGEHVKFYPDKKRGGRKGFSHAEGAAQNVLR